MVNFFDKRRYWGTNRNKFLNKIKYYGISNAVWTFIANAILPLYFNLTKNNERYRLDKSKDNSSPRIIVSLTSFPKRLPTLHLVIESILRQTHKPDRLILYLTKSQVPNLEALPKKLRDQMGRGLEVVLCDDPIRSHTKYYYAVKDNPEDIVITVDDDMFYRDDLIENFVKLHNAYPNCVLANWTKQIIPGEHQYNKWPDATGEPILSKNQLILGVGSVLYPSHSLHPDVFNVDNIINLCLTCDDVWLSAMLLKNSTPILFTNYQYNHLPVNIRNNETLISGNYVRNQKCVDAIDNYYQSKGELRPFTDIPMQNQKM